MSEKTLVKLENLVADENQPRVMFDPAKLKNLRDSITRYGIITPLVVEAIGNKYLIVDGERRFRVATEIGLKDVPVTIIAPESGADRLLKQFHIQEQHEGWTPTEKATSIYRVAKELKVGNKQICELLSLTGSTAKRYMAFADLIDKTAYQKSEVSIEWALPINGLKNLIRRLYEGHDEVFTKADERKVELAVVRRIKSGDLTEKNMSMTKLKDTFVKDYKLVTKFLNTDVTVDELFIKSKAKGAYHLRNAYNNAGYIVSHIRAFLDQPDVEVTNSQKIKFKEAKREIEALLAKVGEDD